MGNRAAPTRVQAGNTTDFPYGPLADCAMGNPFLYHFLADDFDYSIASSGTNGASGQWVVVKSSTGTIVHTAGDGGLVLFSPAGTAADYSYLQQAVAAFTVTTGQKLFFLCRFMVTATTMANPTVILGLTQHQISATPAITDGVYFTKANTASGLALVSNVGSTATSTAVPSSTIVTATSYDAGFEVTPNGELVAFFGPNLVGFRPQSGTAAGGTAVRGKVLRVPGLTFTTATLSPMLSILAGDTSSPTLTVDFVMVGKER